MNVMEVLDLEEKRDDQVCVTVLTVVVVVCRMNLRPCSLIASTVEWKRKKNEKKKKWSPRCQASSPPDSLSVVVDQGSMMMATAMQVVVVVVMVQRSHSSRSQVAESRC